MSGRSSAYLRQGLVAIVPSEARALWMLLDASGALRWARANNPAMLAALAPVLEGVREAAAVDNAASSGDVPHGIPPVDGERMMRFLSAVGVAKRLGVSARAVRGLAQRGALPGERTPAGWRFDPVDVEEYLERRESA